MAALRSSAKADGDRSRCFRWLAKGLRLHCLSAAAIRCDTKCKAIRGIGVAGGDPVAPGMISKALTSGSFVHDDGATQGFDVGVPPLLWRSEWCRRQRLLHVLAAGPSSVIRLPLDGGTGRDSGLEFVELRGGS
jgi:hypothetical protein